MMKTASKQKKTSPSSMSYLIDQQCSAEIELTINKDGAQPITLTENIAMADYSKELIKLSRVQALKLAEMLKNAALKCPKIKPGVEYPGFLIE